MSMNSHLAPEDEIDVPSTGPRREPPSPCYAACGEDAEDDGPQLDGHLFCSCACLDAWVRRP